MRLPSTWAWEEEYPPAYRQAIGTTDTVAAAAQTARAADQAEKKAQLQRLQAQASTQQASDLRVISADKAEENSVSAAAAADVAAADADAQRKKAAMAREVASFGHRFHDTLDDYVVTQTTRNMPQAQPEPTAPPQHMVEELVVAPSPPRTNRATGPVSSWYPHLPIPTCFGGDGGGHSRSSLDCGNRRRKPQL